jgi:hypothetical protein
MLIVLPCSLLDAGEEVEGSGKAGHAPFQTSHQPGPQPEAEAEPEAKEGGDDYGDDEYVVLGGTAQGCGALCDVGRLPSCPVVLRRLYGCRWYITPPCSQLW